MQITSTKCNIRHRFLMLSFDYLFCKCENASTFEGIIYIMTQDTPEMLLTQS